ncbi:hypothetical protein SAMN04487934_10228 [Eubacterium ruminantium]|nr:hypothetical protein SAMN04487934_10228 [Eubacterium ruminantium]
MPKKNKYNLYIFDVDKTLNLSAFIIYGLLRNVISEKEKNDIFSKIGLFHCIRMSSKENVTGIYGDKFAWLVDNATQASVQDEKPHFHLLDGDFNRYPDENWNDALDIFMEGVKELSDVMNKKAAKIQFKTEYEKNYYNLMQLMIGTIASGGSWRDLIEKDVSLQYAWNTTIKFNLTAAYAAIKTNEQNELVFSPDVADSNDGVVINALGEAGIISAVTGGVRARKKLEDHINNGDITRDELIREYEAQEKRLEKALGITEKDFEKLKKANAVQNGLDEFTNGERGYGYVLEDVRVRKNILKAGWPATDVDTIARVGKFLRHMNKRNEYASDFLESDVRKLQLDREKAERDHSTEEKQAEFAEREADLEYRRTRLEPNKALTAELSGIWDELVQGNGMTAVERMNKLTKVKLFLDKVKDNEFFTGAENVHNHVNDRINAELSPADKAVVAENISDFVSSLKAVDPKLVSSSKQFAEFKRELIALEKMRKELDQTDPEKVDAYKEQVKLAAEKATTYLRYKTHQFKSEWKQEHTRSELETKRVSTVSSILDGLKNLTVPGTNEKIIPENNEYHVYDVPETKDLLGEYADPSKGSAYDKIMKRYTGRGVVNGTVEEMREAFARAVTAKYLKEAHPNKPFDKDEANKLFKRVKKELNIDAMDAASLREGLASPKAIGNAINRRLHENYGLTNEGCYESFVEDMRQIYKHFPEVTPKTKRLMEVYKNIEKLAHLPDSLEGVDKEKVFNLITTANHKIYKITRSRILDNPDDISTGSKWCVRALNLIGENSAGIKCLSNVLGDEVNKARGVKYRNGHFEMSTKYFDIDQYDKASFEEYIDEHNEVRDLSEDLSKDIFDAVKPIDVKEKHAELKEVKQEVQDQADKSKEAPVKESKKEPVTRPRAKSMG